MTDQTVISFSNNGPANTGLQQWDEIPAETLVSGSPVQRGHEYFSTAGGTLTAGVWDCTPMEEQFGDYSVNEFMIVLEGSIEIIDQHGTVEIFKAGESFVIPKGLPCTWRQTEYAKKFYVIFDDPSELNVPTDSLRPIRVDLQMALEPMGEQNPDLFISDAPDMNVGTIYKDQSDQYVVAIWDSPPMHRKPANIARNELMHILEGSGTITNADGVVFSFTAGDTFMVPIGMGYEWNSTEYVKKVFCSFTPNT